MKTFGISYTLFLAVMFLLLIRMHPSAQDVIPTPEPELISTEYLTELFNIGMVIVGGIFTGFGVLIFVAIIALYKSVPPTFQHAYLEFVDGVLIGVEKRLNDFAEKAKTTETKLDDAIASKGLDAVHGLQKRLEDTPNDANQKPQP